MQDRFRNHLIADRTLRVLNPLGEHQLPLLAEVCGLSSGMRHLDLVSGKGEILCQYAARYGISGVGIDISEPFLNDAVARGRYA